MTTTDKFTWQPGDIEWDDGGAKDKADANIRQSTKKQDDQETVAKILKSRGGAK